MIEISIPDKLVEGIFNECDYYKKVETGGRLIGFYTQRGRQLKIEVKGLIHAGPKARRTATSFFHDGDYQERIFRAVERKFSRINHLGNWHTHHPNGLETLSKGDVETYTKNVNSPRHSTDFFYALLVTKATPNSLMRYAVRHYVFRRGQQGFVEVPESCIVAGSILRWG